MGQKLFSNCYSEFSINVIWLEFGKFFNWIQMNMVFKSRCSTKIYKIGFLKKMADFTWKHLRSITLRERHSSGDVFLWVLRKFWEPFVAEHLGTTASEFFHSLNYFLLIEIKFLDLRCFHVNSANFLRN